MNCVQGSEHSKTQHFKAASGLHHGYRLPPMWQANKGMTADTDTQGTMGGGYVQGNELQSDTTTKAISDDITATAFGQCAKQTEV